MPGIEHPQVEQAVRLLAAPESFDPGHGLVFPAKATPNQEDLAVSLGLGLARLGRLRADEAIARAVEFYSRMERYGHQKTLVGTYSNEQGAPDPHSGLWAIGNGTSLREVGLLHDAGHSTDPLAQLLIRYWGDHCALGKAFWTPAGMRCPCARAKPAPPRPLAPNWTVDSVLVASLLQEPLAGLHRAVPDDAPVRIVLDGAARYLGAVQARAKAGALKLGIPVERWERSGGGFYAALVRDEPMNDRLSWLEVDAAGAIIAADATLATFARPAGEPVLIGGSVAPAEVPDPPPAPPPSSGPAPTDPLEIARALQALTLGSVARQARKRALLALEEGAAEEVRAEVEIIRANINPGQVPAVDAILAALKSGA